MKVPSKLLSARNLFANTFMYSDASPPAPSQFEEDSTSLYSECIIIALVSILVLNPCVCIILELYYGGYWKGRSSSFKSRNTNSLATIAVTLMFNISSDK